MLRSVQGPQARAPYLRTSGFNVKAKPTLLYRSRRGASGSLGMFLPQGDVSREGSFDACGWLVRNQPGRIWLSLRNHDQAFAIKSIVVVALSSSAKAKGCMCSWPGGPNMKNHVYKILEIVGSSQTGIEDAINTAVELASKTVRNMDWFEVVETRGHIKDGKIAHYQVTLKIGFTLETQ
jgi:dodecin